MNRETEALQLALADDPTQAETWARAAAQQLGVAHVLCRSHDAAVQLAIYRLAELMRDAVHDQIAERPVTWGPHRDLSKAAAENVDWVELARCVISGVTGDDGSGCLVPPDGGASGPGDGAD